MTLLRPASERPPEAESEPTPEVLFREARRRRRRRWGLGLLTTAAAAGLVAGLLGASGPPPPPRHPAQADNGRAPSAKSTALSSMAWPARQIAPTRHVRSVVATTAALYWITGSASTTCHPGATVPVRFDPTNGTRYRGAPFSACDVQQLVAAGGSVWALERTTSALEVASLDPRTLAVTTTESFPETPTTDFTLCGDRCVTLAAGPGTALWLTNGGEIWRLSATSGAIEGQFTPVSSAPVLAPSPTGSVLYTSGKNPAGGGAVVEEYAISSGSLLAQATHNWCVVSGPTALAAGLGGVWTSCMGGNAGDVYALSSNGLTKVTRPQTSTPHTPQNGPFLPEHGPFFHGGAIRITTNGGPLWLDTEGELFCADPATGSILAKEPLRTELFFGFGPFAVVGSDVYSTLSMRTLKSTTPADLRPVSVAVSVAAPKACFGP